MTKALPIAFSLALNACMGGGGGGGVELAPSVTPLERFSFMEANAFSLEAMFDPFAPSPTALSTLPSGSGAPTATYNGHVRGELSGGTIAGRDIIGDLTLVADFGADTISGSAKSFVDSTGQEYSGSLSGSASIIRNTGGNRAEVIPTLSGSLGGNAANIALDGVFAGASYDGAAGLALGSIGSSTFDGTFAAER